MKKTLFVCIILFLITPVAVYAQGINSYVEYAYDAAGNRVLRKIIHLTDNIDTLKSLTSSDSLLSGNKPLQSLTGYVLIYPNPTKGQVTLKITDLNDDELAEYTIYTLSGQKLKEGKTVHKCTVINFDTYSPGVYLLNVKFREKTEFWKIVKEY
ncbi:MAG: T9SS type A sorting domain-containing protein [Bacteroidales bacterium]|nr:T9SS type A sorting domain-containing protein [Bacteroidales bacterium]